MNLLVREKSVEIPSREITINEIELDDSHFPKIRFRVLCSKGTYIRSLAHDFGQALGSGAHLTALRREAIGDFSVKKAFTVETFEDLLRESFEQKT